MFTVFDVWKVIVCCCKSYLSLSVLSGCLMGQHKGIQPGLLSSYRLDALLLPHSTAWKQWVLKCLLSGHLALS